MSHIVSIQSKVRDPIAITSACARLNLPTPVQGTAKLFSGECAGLLVQFPGWQYPAVIDTQTGTVKFDNFNGRWGDQQYLDRFLQMYAVEKAKLEARKKGYFVTEQTVSDGSIKLQIIEGAKS
jgi:hypothetical protein